MFNVGKNMADFTERESIPRQLYHDDNNTSHRASISMFVRLLNPEKKLLRVGIYNSMVGSECRDVGVVKAFYMSGQR